METKKTVCGICWKSPCYLQCPTQDPYAGDQRREHEDHEAGAMYDDVRERYAAEVADMERFAESEAAYEQIRWEEEEAARIAAGLPPTPPYVSPVRLIDPDDDLPF